MSKQNTDKWNPLLIYTSALKALSDVRNFGVKKYGEPEDWRTTQKHEHVAAALRHIYEYQDGVKKDPESGFSHIAHAMTNLMFLIESEYTEERSIISKFKNVGNEWIDEINKGE